MGSIEVVPFDRAVHDRSRFESGEPVLDTWLREHVSSAARQDGARTYVTCENGHVVGYYSLCAFSVDCDEAPSPARYGKYPIPSILLARLAVRKDRQRDGVGSRLLLDALGRSVEAADLVGARLMVVHALHDEAAEYYRRQGFRPFDADPLTLYILMKNVRHTLTQAGLR